MDNNGNKIMCELCPTNCENEKCKYCTKEMILKSDIGPIKRKRSNQLHAIFNGLNKGFKIPKES